MVSLVVRLCGGDGASNRSANQTRGLCCVDAVAVVLAGARRLMLLFFGEEHIYWILNTYVRGNTTTVRVGRVC